MPRPRTLIPTVLACVAVGAVTAAPADASSNQEAVLQDDPKIVFHHSPEDLRRHIQRAKSIGVDRIRVSVFWNLFGPAPTSRSRPSFAFGPADPRSYRIDAWRRYDRIVKTASEEGVGVLLNLTGPAPHWAAAPKGRGFNQNRVVRPDAAAFGNWVSAVGSRYSGLYADPEPTVAPTPPTGRRPAPPPLPVVRHWSIWNEPNFPSWLFPQWRRVRRKRLIPASPARYRSLVDAAFDGLRRTGHGTDTFLLGETSSGGAREYRRGVQPLIFLRELYCLNRRYAPYSGRAAKLRGCPSTASERAGFVSAHPGLFANVGWAHHPYNRYFPPGWRHPERDSVTLGDLRRLTRVLDRVFFRWRDSGAVSVWITEHGYQTRPPDPTAKVRPFRAGRYLAEADFIAYRNPRVASTAQFLLFDDAPRRKYPRRKRRVYWGTWQSGLFTESGAPKPALDFFRYPIAVSGRKGLSRRLWGQYRPASDRATIQARIEFKAFRAGGWTPLQTVSVQNPRGFIDQRIRLPRSGRVRIVWKDPGTGAEHPSPPLQVRNR